MTATPILACWRRLDEVLARSDIGRRHLLIELGLGTRSTLRRAEGATLTASRREIGLISVTLNRERFHCNLWTDNL